MVKVSVIIPVFNVEKYLKQCLDNLLNQTLKDIEIICINDGSTDKSLEILNDYAKKDYRVKVVNKQNEGQGIARNLGLETVKGEFLSFIDPDDWVETDMFEKMYLQAKDLNSQVVICDYTKFFEKNGKIITPHIFRKAVSLTKSKAIKIPNGENIYKNLIDKTILVSPSYTWNAIYEKELLKRNNIKFTNQRCYEDVLFTLQSRTKAQRISYINKSFYNYRIRSTSTLRSNNSRYRDLINVIKAIKKYLYDENLMGEYQYNFNYFCISNIYRVFTNMSSDEDRKHLLEQSMNILDKNLIKVLRKKLLTSLKLYKEIIKEPLKVKHKLGNFIFILRNFK